MAGSLKKLCFEMGAIILAAVLIGISWNHKMLLNVWSGKQSAAPAPSSVAPDKGILPLPAGLLQAKEFFNRKQAVFVDARDAFIFAQGHISGAVSLPLGQFDAKLAEFMIKVPLATTLFVYCSGYGCHDSMKLGQKLIGKGYQRVFIYEGGFPEWKDNGLPTEGEKP